MVAVVMRVQSGQRVKIGQCRVYDAHFVRLRKVGRMLVQKVGETRPEVPRPALFHGGDVRSFRAPPADDSRRRFHSGAAPSEVVVATVTARGLHAPRALAELEEFRVSRRGHAAVYRAPVAIAQGRTDAGALGRLQIARAVGARRPLVTDAVRRTPAALGIRRAAQLGRMALAVGRPVSAAHHFQGYDVGEEVPGYGAAIAAEHEKDVLVFDGRRETEDALRRGSLAGTLVAAVAVVENVMAHPRVAAEVVKVQAGIVTDFFAVVLVSVAAEDHHVRTHENGAVERPLERDVKVWQSAARVEQLRPVEPV